MSLFSPNTLTAHWKPRFYVFLSRSGVRFHDSDAAKFRCSASSFRGMEFQSDVVPAHRCTTV